jgi:uridine kinase
MIKTGNLILVRGLPGSGKSTLAQDLVNDNYEVCGGPAIVLEADMFFMENEKYVFEGSKLPEAHNWCKKNTEVFLNNGYLVIVANTFSRLWEMSDYLAMSNDVMVWRCTGNFESLHGVPLAAIQKMKLRFEDFPGEVVTHPRNRN